MILSHVRHRMLQRLEDMQEQAQSDRQARYREESDFGAKLLPETRARILARWRAREEELLRERKPHAVEKPRDIRPIPNRRTA